MKKILKVEQIQKYYGNKENITKAIDGISFDVEEGEFIGIMGASGSGKTTLLNCISTIDNVSSGHIYLDGKDITEIKEENIAKFRRENLGFIFQDFNLLDTLTIEENIALILTINKVQEKEIDKKILQIAEKLGIKDILNKYPYQVSGGQKQRLSIARTLSKGSKIILFDEATSALDNKSQEYIKKTIDNLVKDHTIVIVAHRLSTIIDADIIFVVDDGKVVSSGTHNELLKTSDIYKNLYETESLNS